MNEMSIIVQIKSMEELIQYSSLFDSESDKFRIELETKIKELRKEGLPKETAEIFQSKYLDHIFHLIGMMQNKNKELVFFLNDKKNILMELLNQ